MPPRRANHVGGTGWAERSGLTAGAFPFWSDCAGQNGRDGPLGCAAYQQGVCLGYLRTPFQVVLYDTSV